MKRKTNLLFSIVVVFFLVLWYLGAEYGRTALNDVFILLCGGGIVISLYLLNRFIIFRKKLELALRHILENNFKTGISLPGKDEWASLAATFNAAIDRINEYDRLRENRINTLNRLIMTINRSVQNGIMLMDLESGRIKLNKAAQDSFSVNQDELSIDSVIKLESNAEFSKLYADILGRRANTIAADLEFFLPVLRAKAMISLKMFAIKDKDEQLQSVLCVFSKS